MQAFLRSTNEWVLPTCLPERVLFATKENGAIKKGFADERLSGVVFEYSSGRRFRRCQYLLLRSSAILARSEHDLLRFADFIRSVVLGRKAASIWNPSSPRPPLERLESRSGGVACLAQCIWYVVTALLSPRIDPRDLAIQ